MNEEQLLKMQNTEEPAVWFYKNESMESAAAQTLGNRLLLPTEWGKNYKNEKAKVEEEAISSHRLPRIDMHVT